tara:strand:- start:19 stop:660 length:642 start_codon:yes stop_codon:yes gene_type:complete
MSYFRELPNINYISLLKDKSRNDERILVKNIFKRAKLRTDIDQAITAFEYYEITENMRPDVVAQNIYGDPELDWIILITNNITNIRDQWPLNNNDLNEYMIEKYGVTGLNNVHHYETTEMKDDQDRMLLEAGMQVDENFTFQVGDKTYTPVQQVTNQQYEVDKNEEKRRIKILKSEFVSMFISDLRNTMKYSKSSQYINKSVKESYNPNTTGV